MACPICGFSNGIQTEPTCSLISKNEASLCWNSTQVAPSFPTNKKAHGELIFSHVCYKLEGWSTACSDIKKCIWLSSARVLFCLFLLIIHIYIYCIYIYHLLNTIYLFIYVCMCVCMYVILHVKCSYLYMWDASSLEEPISKVLIRLNAEDGVAEVTWHVRAKLRGFHVMMDFSFGKVMITIWFMYICSYIHSYVHTYLPTYIHTYIPTYLPTYLRTYVQWYEPGQGLLLMDVRVADHITTNLACGLLSHSHQLTSDFCVYRDFVVGLRHQILKIPNLLEWNCWTAWMPMGVCNVILNLCWGLLNPISTEHSCFFCRFGCELQQISGSVRRKKSGNWRNSSQEKHIANHQFRGSF